jgi:hypothetical protein
MERIRGTGDNHHALLSIVSPDQLVRIFATLFDEDSFLSPHGLRALSKRRSTPYQVAGMPAATIEYEPAESHTAMYGGNSNWRGPVWVPINYLIIRALLQYDQFLDQNSGSNIPQGQVGIWLCATLPAISLIGWSASGFRGPDGRRPVYRGVELFQTDPAGKTTCCSISTSATTAPDWEPCIRPVGPLWSPICCSTQPAEPSGWSSTTPSRIPRNSASSLPAQPVRSKGSFVQAWPGIPR